MQNIYQQIIIELIRREITSRDDLMRLKNQIARQAKIASPATSILRKSYLNLIKRGEIKPAQTLDRLLKRREVRTLSGVAIVTVLTKPFPCQGKCIYCPNEKQMPKSYLSNEPAAARALRLKFNPYRQVTERIKTLEENGHPTDKIELIVKGGTWSAYPWSYQKSFIRRCFMACNDYEKISKSQFPISNQIPISKIQNLLSEQRRNETASHRIVGLTLETRPDYITEDEIRRLRELGCTRIELGAQTTDNSILNTIKRGHNLNQIKEATKLLKDAGFKVDYHLMPQLPGTSPKKDWQMFKTVFNVSDLRPDMIKIYPCAVVRGSPLYKLWRKGLYNPYSNKKLIELLIKVKSQIIPRYCRISRLIRDIPSTSIEAGNRITNLREIIQKEIKKRGLKCKCLRCREIGHRGGTEKRKNERTEKLKIFVDKYSASGGTEYFLTVEDEKREVVYAFCRLRFPSQTPSIFPELKNAALIRELHTYGQLVPLKNIKIQEYKNKAVQHTGLGRQLMKKAEQIASQHGFKKIAVIAGIGAREYYRKLGYKLQGTYMIKNGGK